MEQVLSTTPSETDDETLPAFLARVRKLIEDHRLEDAAAMLLQKAKELSDNANGQDSNLEMSDRLAYHSEQLSSVKGPFEPDLEKERQDLQRRLDETFISIEAHLDRFFDYARSIEDLAVHSKRMVRDITAAGSRKDASIWLWNVYRDYKDEPDLSVFDEVFFERIRHQLRIYQHLPPKMDMGLCGYFAHRNQYIQSGQYVRYISLRKNGDKMETIINRLKADVDEALDLATEYEELRDQLAGCYHQAGMEAEMFSKAFSDVLDEQDARVVL